jgi:hypothetical protein
MKRAWRGAMPVALTLPLGLERKPRVRQRRLRRLAIGALILGAALLAAGFWLPVKAELAQRLLSRASSRTAGSVQIAEPGQHAARVATNRSRLRTLSIGDELTLERDGSEHTYLVEALDVIDSERAEFPLETDDGAIVLVTRWPFDAVTVGGSWRYVVTARKRS